MAGFSPTWYRTALPEPLRTAYRQITAALLHMEHHVTLRPPVPQERVKEVVQAVHKDHPELFYVDFWRFQTTVSRRGCVRLSFRFLLEPATIRACRSTMNRRIEEVRQLCAAVLPENRCHRIARYIASDVRYQQEHNENALLYHSITGALLNHRSVCEGIAKLFLLYCQHLHLPCVLVYGTLGGQPHAWNLVETKQGPRHIDVTAELGFAGVTGFCMPGLLKRGEALRARGYRWEPLGLEEEVS